MAEGTDAKPRGEWSSLRLSRGAKEEDNSQGGKPEVNEYAMQTVQREVTLEDLFW